MRVQLGEELKEARTARSMSLEAVSGAAKISQGYLHKLEAGRVENPSPRVLQRLSGVLDLPYRRLMELADYLMPMDAPTTAGREAQPKETGPMAAQSHAPTNAELLRLLEEVRTELAELKAGQQRLAETLEHSLKRGA